MPYQHISCAIVAGDEGSVVTALVAAWARIGGVVGAIQTRAPEPVVGCEVNNDVVTKQMQTDCLHCNNRHSKTQSKT